MKLRENVIIQFIQGHIAVKEPSGIWIKAHFDSEGSSTFHYTVFKDCIYVWQGWGSRFRIKQIT